MTRSYFAINHFSDNRQILLLCLAIFAFSNIVPNLLSMLSLSLIEDLLQLLW